jgi:tetratricopeptide (TPR) repeat protein
MKSIDKYLFQAMDNYPYCLEETLESLDYSLSYNQKNTMALCLYGRIFAEQLQNYDEAKAYFEEAISYNINAIEVYPFYIETLILNEDFDHAHKLIEFALTIKGINKVVILLKKAFLLEVQKEFKKALKTIKEAKLLMTNNYFQNHIEICEKRINEKIKILKPKKKKK